MHITTRNSTMAPQVFLLLLLLHLLPFLGSPTSGEESPSPFPGLTSHLRPTTAVTVTILVVTFVLTVFAFLYCRHRPLQRYRIPLSRDSAPFISFAPHGLDRRLLASFPTLLYSDVKNHKLSKHALECAVCLCEFEDHETLTLVPRCHHAFHPDCISMWLSSHVTCPVCRRSLDEEEEEQEQKQEEVVVVEIDVEVQLDEHEEEAEETEERRSQRSKSGRWWTEAESERFRLVLPEEVVERKRRRIGRSESERRTYGGYHGSGRRVRRWDRGARSEHWGGAIVRTLSGRAPAESYGGAREMETATFVGSRGDGGENSGRHPGL